ncbi:MAG: PAS domain S-box protein [Promethearchaeota archaeon]
MTIKSTKNYKIDHVLSENLDELIYILNKDFICDYINESYHKKKLGYSALSKKFTNFIHNQDLKTISKFLKKVFNGEIAIEQVRILCNSDYKYYELKGKKFLDNSNEEKVLLICRDISKFKEAEEKWIHRHDRLKDMADNLPEIRYWNLMQPKSIKNNFQKTREMLDIVIDNIPQLIYWKDVNLKYLGCNVNYALINNLEDHNALIGKVDLDLKWPRSNISHIQESEERVMKNNQSERSIESWLYDDGEKVWFEVNRIPLHDLEDIVIGILSTYNNISERLVAEKRIKESEKRYRSILENISEGYFELDLKGNFTFCNSSFCKIFGYSKEEIIGKNYSTISYPEDKAKLFSDFNEVYKTKKSKRYLKSRSIKKNRQEFITEFSVNLLYDTMENIIGFFGIIQDVTEKYMLEQELKQSEEKYRLISESAYDIIAIINQKLKIEYINDQPCFETLGYISTELIGKSVLVLVHPDDFESSKNILISGLKTGKETLVLRIKHKNEKWIWIEAKGNLFRDSDGVLKGILICRNITERKQFEEALINLNRELEQTVLSRTKELRESEEKFRHLYESSPYGIVVIDSNGIIIDINSTISSLFGYNKKDLIGQKYFNLLNIYPEDTISTIQHINDMTFKRKEIKIDIRKIYKKDGSLSWVQSELSRVKIGSENVVQVIVQDVTEKKIAEEKLKKSERKLREQNIELKELDRLKTDFISIAAHELKTPLISVGGFVDLILMREKNLKTEIKEDLERVLNNVRRLEVYINKLMDVMKIDAKKMVLDINAENIYQLISEIIDELHFQIINKNLEIIIEVDNNIELNVDRSRISQVFLNILSNAIKFSQDNNKIEISASHHDTQILFKIKDYGKGLTEPEINKLFGRFVTMDPDSDTFSTFGKGSGLGLYIAKGIIEAHGGKIWVRSQGLDKGSEFIFTIPI